MRYLFGAILALSVGIGAYFGSAKVAGSAATNGRIVKLHFGDTPTFGRVRCIATGNQTHHHFLICEKAVSRPTYTVVVLPNVIVVRGKAVFPFTRRRTRQLAAPETDRWPGTRRPLT